MKKYSTFFIVREFLKFSWESSKSLTISLFLVAFFIGIIPFVDAYIFKLIFDYFIENIDKGFDLRIFGMFGIGLILTRVLTSFLHNLDSYNQVKIKDIFMPLIMERFIMKVLKLPYGSFEDHRIYDIIEKTERNVNWRPQYLLWTIPDVLSALVVIAIGAGVVLSLGWWMIILVLISAIPDYFISRKISDARYSITDTRAPKAREFSYLQRTLIDSDSVKELRVFNATGRLWKKMQELLFEFRDQNAEIARKNLLLSLVSEVIQVVSIGASYVYIFIITAQGRLSLGNLSFSLTSIERFSSGISRLFHEVSELQSHAKFLSDFFVLLDLPEEEDGTLDLSNGFNEIEFKNISFQYPGSKTKVFSNFNLKITKGEKIAVVGVNGAGKTTLIKLLLGFYKPTKGEILVDGVNLRNIKRKEWYKNFGVLFQSFEKYAFTARENIEFGDPEKFDEVLYVGAKEKSDADKVIDSLEKKDEQILTTRYSDGVDLSGGQWQRVALARMYYRDSPVLILDEPTAAIDAISEAKIFENVQKLSEDKTVIIISHRFSTVRKADKIIILDEGKIVESGTHEHLMKINGKYAHMFSLQAEGYK